jgi:formate-dependent nitrite reductase membrane component NrfD
MQLHDWMVKYTPQAAWIDRRGMLVWLSLYAGILGGGVYLASLIFNNFAGMFIGWLIVVVIKGGLHIAHAEKISRLWMMVLRPKTSWISRGLIITGLLALFGAIQLAISLWMPDTAAETIFKVLAGMFSVGVILYAGLALGDMASIPLWNTIALPLQFLVWGLLSGISLVMVVNSGANRNDFTMLLAFLILLVAALVMLMLFLWAGAYSQPAARESVREILRGNLTLPFWLGVVVIGLLIPIIISISMLEGLAPVLSISIVLLVCELAGGLAVSFCIMKAGLYRPLIGS